MSQNSSGKSNQVAIESPVMTQELFSQKVGLTKDTIRGMVYANSLPTVKYGKHRLINVAALTSECLQGISSSHSGE